MNKLGKANQTLSPIRKDHVNEQQLHRREPLAYKR